MVGILMSAFLEQADDIKGAATSGSESTSSQANQPGTTSGSQELENKYDQDVQQQGTTDGTVSQDLLDSTRAQTQELDKIETIPICAYISKKDCPVKKCRDGEVKSTFLDYSSPVVSSGEY